jgi:hypothetical protein
MFGEGGGAFTKNIPFMPSSDALVMLQLPLFQQIVSEDFDDFLNGFQHTKLLERVNCPK